MSIKFAMTFAWLCKVLQQVISGASKILYYFPPDRIQHYACKRQQQTRFCNITSAEYMREPDV